MPANLTPQYKEAEEKYKQARTPQEKIERLTIMLRELPKHKGTNRIQGELRHKLSELRRTDASSKGSKKGLTQSYFVEKHGYRQIVFFGQPNSGKSSLVSALTGQQFKVADYPFTTRVPQPAMMKFEDIVIQVVDTPAISEDHRDSWLPNIIRSADSAVFLIDMGNDDVIKDMEVVENFLHEQSLYLIGDCEENPILPDIAETQQTILVGNKCDIDGCEIIREFVSESYRHRFTLTEVSAQTGQGIDVLKRKLFESLEIVRIYPKVPGKKPDTEPIILDKGSTIFDLAEKIHRDLVSKVKAAKIWNCSKFTEGQRIPTDFELEDKNIIELLEN